MAYPMKVYVLTYDDDGTKIADWGNVYLTHEAALKKLQEWREDREVREGNRKEVALFNYNREKLEHNALLALGLRDKPFKDFVFYPRYGDAFEIEEWEVIE